MSPTTSHSTREDPYLRRGRRDPHDIHTQVYVWGTLGVVLAIWFLTPVSNWIVGVVLWTIPVESDIELGREAWRDLRTKYKLVRDKWGVDQIGWDLVQVLPDQSFEWDFGVVHAPNVVNAFCFPGGIVRVTDTLLYTLNLSNGELAALLGHEIGHVLHRHSQKRIIQKELLSLLLKALVYEDHDDNRETFGQAVGELMLNSARYLGQLSFSRQDEYEADATSWDLLVMSGVYQPQALQSLLSKLWSLEKGSSGKTSWESTHPGTKDRIKALQTKWSALPLGDRKRLARYPEQ